MWARWLVRSWAWALLLVSGCGNRGLMPTGICDGGCLPGCGPGVDAPPIEGQNHVPIGTTVNYRANPPCSGNHWPEWQEPWDVYDTAIPREKYVHNLEHGGIVLLYHCATGCAADVQHLIAIRSSTPPDRFNEVRILVTPDTGQMPHKFAAVAWGYRWQDEMVDEAAIRCFITARYDKGPESIP